MLGHIFDPTRGRGRTYARRATERYLSGRACARLTIISLAFLVACILATAASAYRDTPPYMVRSGYWPSYAFVTDGSFVLNAGELQMNITNWGLIGSAPGMRTTYSDAPSGQWPAGSGNEYLFSAGLWVGGRVLGERLVSTGGWASEWMPLDEPEATIYEAVGGEIKRPPGSGRIVGNRTPHPEPDDDEDGRIDEDLLDGHDNDEDGKIDEDFGQIGTQMMTATLYDNTRLSEALFPDHIPMNLRLVQRAFAWENDASDDFVGFDFTVTNVGVVDVTDIYVGMLVDADIGPRDKPGYAGDDMAGSWKGIVRAPSGGWVPIETGFMWDAAEEDALDGYFGVVFLDHDVDPEGETAPSSVGMRTFQSFAGNASFIQGGAPSNDLEAYQSLSHRKGEWDTDTEPGDEGDHRFLVSAGPFGLLPPDESLTFQLAMVCGPGLGDRHGAPGYLTNCAEAVLTYHGIYVDVLDEYSIAGGEGVNPGELGRETMVCSDGGGMNPFEHLRLDYGDTSCLNNRWLMDQPTTPAWEIFTYEGDRCVMINMDNCWECARQTGRECTEVDFENGSWNCNKGDAGDRTGCTGINGLETQITWLVGMAPPPPGLRMWAADTRVHLFWDDRSERTPDIRLQRIDFESYRIWRADNWDRPFGAAVENGPESGLWQLLAEYDVVNLWVRERREGNNVFMDTITLGANTGLDDIAYRPRSLDNPAYTGLAEAMEDVVNADPTGRLLQRPQLRTPEGIVIPEYSALLPWEGVPDVMDTFFAAAEREPGPGVEPKTATRFYEYIDRGVHNGFLYFYSVSATDHALPMTPDTSGVDMPRGPGLAGDPGSSFVHGSPGTEAQTADERASEGTNIYVFPNPATRSSLAEYQQFDPSGSDPTGVRVTFTNLPMASNTVTIYTASGEMVQTLSHDGTGGSGFLHWNLMSRNAQEVVSGVYLYSVQSSDSRFEDFVGKFVVIR